jgi:hypothetical protein
MEGFFISGELNCRRIMSIRYGRIGISWTLRQKVGQTFLLRRKISGPEFLEKNYLNTEWFGTRFLAEIRDVLRSLASSARS